MQNFYKVNPMFNRLINHSEQEAGISVTPTNRDNISHLTHSLSSQARFSLVHTPPSKPFVLHVCALRGMITSEGRKGNQINFFLLISFHVGLFTVISMSLANTGKPSKP